MQQNKYLRSLAIGPNFWALELSTLRASEFLSAAEEVENQNNRGLGEYHTTNFYATHAKLTHDALLSVFPTRS